jgi:hypothetical protein
MADRLFFQTQCLNLEEDLIVGSFAPAGTGAPTATNGLGYTVTRTGVGTFSVALNDEYYTLLACGADLQLATPTDEIAQMGAVNVESTGAGAQTATITTLSSASGAAVDIAANASNRVNFWLHVQNTSAPPT